jgi:hypothetical protein
MKLACWLSKCDVAQPGRFASSTSLAYGSARRAPRSVQRYQLFSGALLTRLSRCDRNAVQLILAVTLFEFSSLRLGFWQVVVVTRRRPVVIAVEVDLLKPSTWTVCAHSSVQFFWLP